MIVSATWDSHGLGRPGLEVLGAAVRLGAALGEEVALVALGEGSAAGAAAAGGFGVARSFAVEGDLSASGAEGYVSVLAAIAAEVGARVVLLVGDERGAEVGPRLAERLGGTAITHVLAVEVDDGGGLVWTRPVFGGKALATVVAMAEPAVATLRRGAFEAAEPTGGTAAAETRPSPPPGGLVQLVGTEAPDTGVPIDQASVVVAGGRGLGGLEGFAHVEQLAGLLNGAAGASLGAVDEGWAAQDRQVGLTGKTVSPDVYFAIGISGASQHLAGIGGAKAVVAVNTDPEAPIFGAARLGVVMDCNEFLPALIEELRRRLAQ